MTEPQKNKLVRVGLNFDQELEFIKDERVKSGIDKFKVSTKKLTNLIVKHGHWSDIREDTLKFKFKSRGRSKDE